ncbi:hypothetical protein TSOC_004607 [Tetrabaena socialis]|uniref:Uncharacterized protein n=1 Tax=Tetrabaena socialis TaxID=47790 RepID=A0A2J8A8F0_9CHLO|nr:hypothetical protein TSOC_004607 [Tetrabaena socialis]|eukprot:PNH08812.1 hypothetical protein TSOC_004607 [Tetrabaena socialis]
MAPVRGSKFPAVGASIFAAGAVLGLLIAYLAGGPSAIKIAGPGGMDGIMFRIDINLNFLRGNPYSRISEKEAKKTAAELPWVHRVRLFEDFVTGGQWEEDRGFHIPTNLTGQSFLDLGAWDGYFTFLAEDRGASSVTAVDYCCWGGREYGVPEKPDIPWNKGGSCCPADGRTFKLAHAVRKSKAKAVRVNVYDLRPEFVGGQHDVVLFAGVLYHLRFPFLAMTRVASVTKRMLIIETTISPKIETNPEPVLLFYPGKELNNDPTNWFDFNVPSLTAMLRVLGFVRVELVNHNHSKDMPRVTLHAYKY